MFPLIKIENNKVKFSINEACVFVIEYFSRELMIIEKSLFY